MNIPKLDLTEKYIISVYEAAAYFNIGEKKLRELIRMNPGRFAFQSGHRTLIVKHKMEEFFDDLFEIERQEEEMRKNATSKPRQKRTAKSKRSN